MITQYGPFVCVGLALALLFVLWSFFGANEEYEFIGISPLAPDDLNPFHDPSLPICPVNNNIGKISSVTEVNDPAITIDQTPKLPEQFAPVASSSPLISSPPKKRGRFVSKGEKICCQTLEKIYGLPFVSARPLWLTNTETGRPLELDCYNEQLQIALEYNGEQHYRWPNFTNQSHEEFINQVRRDIYKTEMCKQHNVYLITVPYNVKHSQISDYIASQLPEAVQERLRETCDS